jgi:nucleoid-associated protein
MDLKKIIVHELRKDTGSNVTSLILSDTLIPINSNSNGLVDSLLSSYQGDRILYAEYDNSPGKYFPNLYDEYVATEREDVAYVEFTKSAVGNLETIIKPKTLARGGYIVFTEYENNNSDFIGIFLIRDTEGKLLRRRTNTFEIQNISYLDTQHLAMACRINETKYRIPETNYLSFTRLRQKEVSDYFTDWISIKQLESSTEYTKALYDIINALPLPRNLETDEEYSIDEVRNMVFETANANSNKTINLKHLGEQIYGDESIITNYIEENDLSIDTEFRFDKRALKKFIQISVRKDGISLRFSRGDSETKIKLSEENPNQVIIESASFATALREQIEQ